MEIENNKKKIMEEEKVLAYYFGTNFYEMYLLPVLFFSKLF